MLDKTVLTGRTLRRFEETYDCSVLSEAQIRRVEQCAFLTNLGAGLQHLTEDGVWEWFMEMVTYDNGIHLNERRCRDELGRRNTGT